MGTVRSGELVCMCGDGGCPVCRGHCCQRATTVLYRVDMEDSGGTQMCEGCAEDAYESGLCRGEDDHDAE